MRQERMMRRQIPYLATVEYRGTWGTLLRVMGRVALVRMKGSAEVIECAVSELVEVTA